MIECSSTILLIHAVEPDASEVMSEAWFYVRLSFSFSDWNVGSKMLAFSISFSVRKWE